MLAQKGQIKLNVPVQTTFIVKVSDFYIFEVALARICSWKQLSCKNHLLQQCAISSIVHAAIACSLFSCVMRSCGDVSPLAPCFVSLLGENSWQLSGWTRAIFQSVLIDERRWCKRGHLLVNKSTTAGALFLVYYFFSFLFSFPFSRLSSAYGSRLEYCPSARRQEEHCFRVQRASLTWLVTKNFNWLIRKERRQNERRKMCSTIMLWQLALWVTWKWAGHIALTMRPLLWMRYRVDGEECYSGWKNIRPMVLTFLIS